jgi:serine/threonine-protein kinase RsbW
MNRIAVTRGLILARDFAETAALSPDEADHLALIVEEWLNNVTEHSGAPPGTRIVLRLRRGPGVVQVIVTDGGMPFDPRTVTFEGPNLTRGGGAGLAMIQAWCRIAAYRRTRGRNCLVFAMALT